MSGSRSRSASSKTEGGDGEALAKTLATAQNAVAKRGDGWTIDECHFRSLRREFERLGLSWTEPKLTLAIRAAFGELQHIHRRSDESYSGLQDGQTLYESAWESVFYKRTMYIKFALPSSECVELIRLHESNSNGRDD